LVVGLVMLTVLTLLVVTAIKVGILELKIGGVSYGAAQNFANIDLALAQDLNVNGPNFHSGCLNADRSNPLTLAQSCIYPGGTPPGVTVSGNPGNYVTTYELYAGKVDVQAQEVSCITDAARGRGNNLSDSSGKTAPDLYVEDMTARAQGNISGQTIVRQGGRRLLAPCACGNC